MRIAFAALACLASLTTAPAQALAEASRWVIDPDASSVRIQFQVNDEWREGRFETYRGEAVFDPDDLEAAELRFEIETNSIDLNEPFATAIVKTVDWLSVSAHPTAVYELQQLTRMEGGTYRAEGLLTMRGATHPVTGELALAIGDAEASADGKAGFPRANYGVGVGITALFVTIGPEIGVTFDLRARKVE